MSNIRMISSKVSSHSRCFERAALAPSAPFGMDTHRPLVALHLGDGHAVDLTLGDHDLLAALPPEMLAEQSYLLEIAQGHEALVREPDFLGDDLSFRGIVGGHLDRLLSELVGGVVKLPAGFLGDASLGQRLDFPA